MAELELKNGQGIAFLKQKASEKHPDFAGEIVTPEGKKYEISIWRRTAASGKEYLSFAVKEPWAKVESKPVEFGKKGTDNDLPWE